MQNCQTLDPNGADVDRYVGDDVHGSSRPALRAADANLSICLQCQRPRPRRLEKYRGGSAGIERETHLRAAVHAHRNDQMTVVPLEWHLDVIAWCAPNMPRLGIAALDVVEPGSCAKSTNGKAADRRDRQER